MQSCVYINHQSPNSLPSHLVLILSSVFSGWTSRSALFPHGSHTKTSHILQVYSLLNSDICRHLVLYSNQGNSHVDLFLPLGPSSVCFCGNSTWRKNLTLNDFSAQFSINGRCCVLQRVCRTCLFMYNWNTIFISPWPPLLSSLLLWYFIILQWEYLCPI